MNTDVDGKMFLVKDFQVKYQAMGDAGDPSAPTIHLVTLQVLTEVGGPTNQMGSPLMFLNPKTARELGQRLLREAKAATESSQKPSHQKKRH